MKNYVKAVLVIIIMLSFFSCEKKEGEGGTATIMGRVYAKNFNKDFTVNVGEYYASDRDVFIIYGKDSIYSDDFKTSKDGWYRFEYLNPGEYTVFTYSEDSAQKDPSNMIPVSKTVIIGDNDENVILDDLVIFEEKKSGSSTIMGRVFVKNYNTDFRILLGTYYAPNVRVFINYGNDSIYFDDFRTGLDGWYKFENLDKGEYTVYTFSADSTRMDPSNMVPVMQTLLIDEDNSTHVVDDLVIFD